MTWLNTLLILTIALLAIFLEATVGGIRHWLGAQVDVLPGLMVYVGLSSKVGVVALVAMFSGLCYDSVSANPLGVSVVPLFFVGLLIHLKRQLILREQMFAQLVLGFAASAMVPLIAALLLLSGGAEPLIGWGSLWQWLVMSVGGAMSTPAFFWLFDRVRRALSYQRYTETTFRPDREIERGRR
jgi:rod shape-determining protein MreD